MKEKIAERIRMARLAKNLSQQNVADELELTVAAYSNIERGVTELTILRLTQIAGILEKDVSEFLGFSTGEHMEEPAAVYKQQNTMTQQILTLSQQLNAVQLQLGQLESDLRKLEKRK